MSTNISAIFQAVITATNNQLSPPPYIANFDFQNPTLNANVIFYEPFFQAVTGGGSVVTLPAAKVFAVIVQNIDATNLLTVTYTPFGGAPTSITLGLQGMFIYFDPNKTGTGISALTLTGTVATTAAFVMAGA